MSDVGREAEKKMSQSVEHFKEELKKIRTGRANPSAFESIGVEVYGTQMRLKDMAQLSAPDARQVLVTPFDPQNANTIGKAIERANMNVKPIVDGNVVRIQIPQMDESVRKEMAKTCKSYCEDAKVSIRQIRKDANDQIKNKKNDKEIAEDQAHGFEKEVQDLTDKYCKECDELSQAKEKEVLTI